MPDLNLKIIGCDELWIELKAGSNHLDLRPPQYAWAMRRIASGGRVAALNRYKALGENMSSWRLYDLARCTFEPKGKHMRAINEPHHVGFSIQHLEECIKELWKPNN